MGSTEQSFQLPKELTIKCIDYLSGKDLANLQGASRCFTGLTQRIGDARLLQLGLPSSCLRNEGENLRPQFEKLHLKLEQRRQDFKQQQYLFRDHVLEPTVEQLRTPFTVSVSVAVSGPLFAFNSSLSTPLRCVGAFTTAIVLPIFAGKVQRFFQWALQDKSLNPPPKINWFFSQAPSLKRLYVAEACIYDWPLKF